MKNVMNDLNETAELMGSADYKERFRAEYWQTLIRYERLKHFCCKIKVSELYGVKGRRSTTARMIFCASSRV